VKITKRQLRRIIQEETRRLMVEEPDDQAPDTTAEEDVSSVSELKVWLVATSKRLGSMKIQGAQVPALKKSIEQLLSAAASGKLKTKAKWVSDRLSSVGPGEE
jgi:hypothetical protein